MDEELMKPASTPMFDMKKYWVNDLPAATCHRFWVGAPPSALNPPPPHWGQGERERIAAPVGSPWRLNDKLEGRPELKLRFSTPLSWPDVEAVYCTATTHV